VLDISVSHTPDCMKAYLYVSDAAGGIYPSESELFKALGEHGVVSGVNAGTLQAMVAEKACNTYVEVAQGALPVPGTPGRMEILVDVSSKGIPRKLADGRVDHRDIGYVVNITKGTPLVKHIPPVQGTAGHTVFNKPIEPLPVSETPIIPGNGAVASPDDRDVLIADIDGAIVIHTDGKIEVIDNKVISGNIDYSTGNVKFSGNLRVTGTVRAGFEIDVEGDCCIGGNVEDAKITGQGDIEIVGGAIGSAKGAIKCGGALKVRHIANFNVQAGGDITIMEDALHCTLSSEGSIRAKNIVGGSVAAWKTVETETIGTEAEPKTIVDLGGRFLLMQRKYTLLKELTALTGEIGSLIEGIFTLTRDEMDTTGTLAECSLARLEALKKDHRRRRDACARVQTDIETLDAKIKNSPIPTIKAQTVYPNTIIKFGTNEKPVREKIIHARITVDGEKIFIGKY